MVYCTNYKNTFKKILSELLIGNPNQMISITGSFKNYDWGKKSNESKVCEMLPKGSFDVDLRYAELWVFLLLLIIINTISSHKK